MILSEKYNNKKVFITGHTGFKGTWLLSILHLFGAKIKGYALEAEKKSIYNQINGNTLCQSIIADIRDKERLQKEISEFAPDYVFHLAAQPLVLDSYDDPLYTYEVNTMGTANLLQACRTLNKSCSVVIVTTDKVYLNQENKKAFSEGDALGGLDPYSGSKACTEIVTTSFRHSFFKNHLVRIASARAGNVIGGGDYAKNRIIPDIVRALSAEELIIIRNPNAIRPWQHVLDCLNGYLILAAKNYNDEAFYHNHEQAWNFGPAPDDKLTVLDLTKHAIEVWGAGKYEFSSQINPVHEAGYLQLDSQKSTENLGWSPLWNSSMGIEQTIVWYKSIETIEASEITAKNIVSFFNLQN